MGNRLWSGEAVDEPNLGQIQRDVNSPAANRPVTRAIGCSSLSPEQNFATTG